MAAWDRFCAVVTAGVAGESSFIAPKISLRRLEEGVEGVDDIGERNVRNENLDALPLAFEAAGGPLVLHL